MQNAQVFQNPFVLPAWFDKEKWDLGTSEKWKIESDGVGDADEKYGRMISNAIKFVSLRTSDRVTGVAISVYNAILWDSHASVRTGSEWQ